jgi:hypothetical protein
MESLESCEDAISPVCVIINAPRLRQLELQRVNANGLQSID